VIVVDRLVSNAPGHRTGHPVEWIGAKRKGRACAAVAEIFGDGFTHDRGDTRPSAARLVAQLLVRLGGQAEIGRRVPSHDRRNPRYRDIAISVNPCGAMNRD
jgi:hypothetical protein